MIHRASRERNNDNRVYVEMSPDTYFNQRWTRNICCSICDSGPNSDGCGLVRPSPHSLNATDVEQKSHGYVRVRARQRKGDRT